ncbi:unnamed protein product [Ciceribacter selenitireducens ATCC BAA-1503]|uniref:Uncharacterized protein n=1 Tax=Ciceribacter selenitireducens ATCC BAA-1503 TaxID=1336235 RepID=A0A376AGX1_9HYPH|nr:unnamed protein product [Ciceribacter selenitireducens ATCC BAA-1503]
MISTTLEDCIVYEPVAMTLSLPSVVRVSSLPPAKVDTKPFVSTQAPSTVGAWRTGGRGCRGPVEEQAASVAVHANRITMDLIFIAVSCLIAFGRRPRNAWPILPNHAAKGW